MQYLLSRASYPLLKRLAQQRTLCAFDFDGTLSPIVEHPDQAGMRGRTRELLARLTALYPCAVISGRARADLLGKLGGIKVQCLVGNHGAETGSGLRRWRGAVARWNAVLERELDDVPGVWIEDKGLSLAVHYRQSASPPRARQKIMAATHGLTSVHVFGGKRVVNLMPDDAPRKGKALMEARRRLQCDWVLYLGDDENDEDAFALEGNVVPVRIGRAQQSRARYYLRTQAEIDTLLETLIALSDRTIGNEPSVNRTRRGIPL